MLCYVKGLADIKQFRVALRLKNCYARKMDFWKLVYLKSQLYLIELNWIELSQWTSVSLSGNISGPRLLACSKFCNQFRALCTASQTCTRYALRITVELQIRGAFHLGKKPGNSVGAKVEFSIGKKLFHLVVNPGTSRCPTVDLELVQTTRNVNGTRHSVRKFQPGKRDHLFRFSTFSGNFPVGWTDETCSI